MQQQILGVNCSKNNHSLAVSIELQLTLSSIWSAVVSVTDLQLMVDTEKAEKQMLAYQLSAVEVLVYDL